MSQSANDLQTLAQEQQTLLMEARRRLGVRDGIDEAPPRRPATGAARAAGNDHQL